MVQVVFEPGELELDHHVRNNIEFLRLTSPKRRNGVKLYVQLPLKKAAPGSVWLVTFKILYRGLVEIQGRENK